MRGCTLSRRACSLAGPEQQLEAHGGRLFQPTGFLSWCYWNILSLLGLRSASLEAEDCQADRDS